MGQDASVTSDWERDAYADDGSDLYVDTGQWDVGGGPDSVVGGTPVPEGRWDDTVGIVFSNNYVGCTGTLVHPKVVVTAGHCVGGITHVAIGSKNWAQDIPEYIAVEEVYEYPNSQSSYDAAVLVLAERSKFDPRPIAIECTLDDHMKDGAEVVVVGFGNTRENGNGSTSVLHEGVTYVQDADGDEAYIEGYYTGFLSSVSPGGEVGAGGNGVDACFGDSGGPLYLTTDDGHALVGITSRAYSGVPGDRPCAYGGIYVRPDAILDWMEEVTGKTLTYSDACNLPPELELEDLVVWGTTPAATQAVVFDPEGKEDKATYYIAVDPEHGQATVDEFGNVQYSAEQGYVGMDEFIVGVTDKGFPKYPRTGGAQTVEQTISVTVLGFSWLDDAADGIQAVGGCACTTAPPMSGMAGGLSLLLVLWGRRRQDGAGPV